MVCSGNNCSEFHYFILEMGQTPFYQTSNELEHQFFEQSRMCSSIGDQTQTPYLWLQTNEHLLDLINGTDSNIILSARAESAY